MNARGYYIYFRIVKFIHVYKIKKIICLKMSDLGQRNVSWISPQGEHSFLTLK